MYLVYSIDNGLAVRFSSEQTEHSVKITIEEKAQIVRGELKCIKDNKLIFDAPLSEEEEKQETERLIKIMSAQ